MWKTIQEILLRYGVLISTKNKTSSLLQHPGGRGRQICKFETSLVNTASSMPVWLHRKTLPQKKGGGDKQNQQLCPELQTVSRAKLGRGMGQRVKVQGAYPQVRCHPGGTGLSYREQGQNCGLSVEYPKTRGVKGQERFIEGREGKYFSVQEMSHYSPQENPRGSWAGTSTMGPSPTSQPCPGRKEEITWGYLPPAELRKLKWLILGLKFLHRNLHPTSTKRALYQKLPQYTGTFHSAEGLMGAKPNTHFQSLSVHVTEPSTRLPLVPDHIRLDRNTG